MIEPALDGARQPARPNSVRYAAACCTAPASAHAGRGDEPANASALSQVEADLAGCRQIEHACAAARQAIDHASAVASFRDQRTVDLRVTVTADTVTMLSATVHEILASEGVAEPLQPQWGTQQTSTSGR